MLYLAQYFTPKTDLQKTEALFTTTCPKLVALASCKNGCFVAAFREIGTGLETKPLLAFEGGTIARERFQCTLERQRGTSVASARKGSFITRVSTNELNDLFYFLV